ncbi:MAG: toll/interleukin-1 receptor domain-containing protein [Phormidesmis sp.]
MPAENSIFISYRRSDSDYVTGHIYERLRSHFGQSGVFRDVVSIPSGVDYRDYLNQAVSGCQVLIAIIGDTWLETLHQRFTQGEPDWVRIEIEAALKRAMPVIPVLIRGAGMPKESELPDELKALAYRNFTQIRPALDFDNDVDRLIRRLEEIVGSPAEAGKTSDAADAYLTAITARLRQAGSLDIRQNISYGSFQFARVAKILDFELGFAMRGEALFIFSVFDELGSAEFLLNFAFASKRQPAILQRVQGAYF